MTYNSRAGVLTYPLPGAARPHAPTDVNGQALTYDANGNLLTGRGRTITWNAANLPVSVNTTQYIYDGNGARLKKITPAGTSLYPVGDDYEVTNGVVTKYANLPGLGLVAKRVGTTTYWLHTDRLGSVQALTDAAGAVVQERTYRPYGEKIADSTSHEEQRGYIGERQDTDTGLSYLHARYYDAALGLFLSPDPTSPLEPGVGANRYSYALSAPTQFADASGLASNSPCPNDGKACFTAWVGIASPEAEGHQQELERGWLQLELLEYFFFGLQRDPLLHDEFQSLRERFTRDKIEQTTPTPSPVTDPPPTDPPKGNAPQEKPTATKASKASTEQLRKMLLGLRDRVCASSGYIDGNVALGSPYLVGGTGGFQFSSRGNLYGYVGSSLSTPGPSASFTMSKHLPTPGWNWGFQVGLGSGAAQGGSAVGGDSSFFHDGFWEVGAGTPGLSLTLYYVAEVTSFSGCR